jgi:hypothetical protein
MQIIVGATCWDGTRRKALSGILETQLLPQIEKQRVLFHPKLTALASFAVPVTLLTGMSPSAFAQNAQAAIPAMSAATKTKILHAFDPLIDLVQSLSYPIAGVMIAGGCLFIMVGNRERGMQMLQNAAIGYILVQLSPMLLELLVGIGSSI